VDRVNNAADDAARQSALADLRKTIGDEDRQHIKPDGFIERLRLSYASGFSLSLRPSASGFDFDPVLFSPERLSEAEEGLVVDEQADSLLPPRQQDAFARRFRQGDGSRRAYLLDDGSIVFLDPRLQQALAVVREAQGGGAEARRNFARHPQRVLSEALPKSNLEDARPSSLFIETQQFSERVSGIDIWRKPVLPWIKPKPNSWLPEAFGLRIGDPPQDTIVEVTPDQVPVALEAVESALREERATFTFNNQELPATEQARDAIQSLAELQAAVDAGADAAEAPKALQRYFLQVRDNLEDVAYAPLVSAPAEAAAPVTLPTSVRSAPKPHQVDGFQWLAACWNSGMPGALLADDMGLGKTFQALSFLAWLRGRSDKPVLIVAPTGLLANWCAEIRTHLEPDALGRVINAYGVGLREMRDADGRDIDVGSANINPEAWSNAGVVLTTYETMRDYHLSFARQPFSAIIYDEAQKLKNPASQTTRAAKTLNGRLQLAMTGTPVENRLQDLWSIFDVIHPGLLGSSKAFETNYPAAGRERLRSLHELLTKPQERRPQLLLRRMKDDCLEGLPAKHVRPLPTEMPQAQATAYDRIIQRALAARGTGRRGHMLEILHMLRGVSLHPVAPEDAADDYLEQSARLKSTFDLLDQIHAKGEKALVFCESLSMQARLGLEIRRRYGLNHDVLRIHGGIDGAARQAAVDTFQKRPAGFDAMILSPKAGGVGLTLTAANHVIHLSRWWNPAVEDQATDRVFRIGQTKDVYVYLPQAVHPDPNIRPSSFDLRLDALMTRKRELSRGLLIPGEDESDIDQLFESVLNQDGAVEAASTEEQPSSSVELADEKLLGDARRDYREPASTDADKKALPASDLRDTEGRPVLSVTQAMRKEVADTTPGWPARMAYAPMRARDYAIFTGPIAREHVTELVIRDPYGCASARNREILVAFVAMLVQSADSVGDTRIVTFDGDSIETRASESSVFQRDDLERKWRDRFSGRPPLRHSQLSRRQHRYFHDRTVRAKTASGREIIWDVSNGLDGVMLPQKECVVHVTVE
jgi:hypothetical protein